MVLAKYCLPETSVRPVPFDKYPLDSGKVWRNIWKLSLYIGMEVWQVQKKKLKTKYYGFCQEDKHIKGKFHAINV